jgi:nuclease S1
LRLSQIIASLAASFGGLTMRPIVLAAALTCAVTGPAWAWGEDGHSIVAEVAQQRLSEPAAQLVRTLLKGRSLASIASWADDYRASHPATANWHFVDIPLDVATYDPARDCKLDKDTGDCVIAELMRVQKDLRCATGEAQAEALKFAVHFVGDIHQPLHAVKEKQGGNDIQVDVFMRGLATSPAATAAHTPVNFHKAWDETLIQRTAWSWGAYVDRLENDWLKTSQEAKAEDPATNHTPIDEKTLIAWAEETHRAAQKVWYWRPADDVLDDRYLRDVLPIMDRQLGIAGLRLARFLNNAASQACGR